MQYRVPFLTFVLGHWILCALMHNSPKKAAIAMVDTPDRGRVTLPHAYRLTGLLSMVRLSFAARKKRCVDRVKKCVASVLKRSCSIVQKKILRDMFFFHASEYLLRRVAVFALSRGNFRSLGEDIIVGVRSPYSDVFHRSTISL